MGFYKVSEFQGVKIAQEVKAEMPEVISHQPVGSQHIIPINVNLTANTPQQITQNIQNNMYVIGYDIMPYGSTSGSVALYGSIDSIVIGTYNNPVVLPINVAINRDFKNKVQVALQSAINFSVVANADCSLTILVYGQS